MFTSQDILEAEFERSIEHECEEVWYNTKALRQESIRLLASLIDATMGDYPIVNKSYGVQFEDLAKVVLESYDEAFMDVGYISSESESIGFYQAKTEWQNKLLEDALQYRRDKIREAYNA